MELRKIRKKTIAFDERDKTDENRLTGKKSQRKSNKKISSKKKEEHNKEENSSMIKKAKPMNKNKSKYFRKNALSPPLSTHQDWNTNGIDVTSLYFHVTYFGHNKSITVG